MLLLHLPDTVQAHGDEGDLKILSKKANAGLESDHAGRIAVIDDAFGKDEQAVAAIGGFARKTKTFPKAGELREGENVEERNDEKVVEVREPALGEKPFSRWMTKRFQGFAAHGGRETMTKARGESIENQTNISAAGGVIGDEEDWSVQTVEVFAATNAGMSEDKRGRPGECVIDKQAEKGHRSTLCPARVYVVRAAGGGFGEELFDFVEGLGFGELRLVEFDVVAVFEGRKQFDTVERGEVFKGRRPEGRGIRGAKQIPRLAPFGFA